MLKKKKDSNIHDLYRYFLKRLMTVVIVSVILSSLIGLLLTANKFNHSLRPQLTQSAHLIAQEISQDIEYAVYVGVPFDEIKGLDIYFNQLLAQYPQFTSIELIPHKAHTLGIFVSADKALHHQVTSTDALASRTGHTGNASNTDIVSNTGNTGNTVKEANLSLMKKLKNGLFSFVSGDDEFIKPVNNNVVTFGAKVATIRLTMNNQYFTEKMSSIFFDTFIILMAAILLVIEIFVVLITFYHTNPVRQFQSTLTAWSNSSFPPINLANSGEFRRITEYLSHLRESLRIRVNRLLSRLDNPILAEELKVFAQNKSLTTNFDMRREASVFDVRLPLFFYLFAEGLQLPFLPIFIKEKLGDTSFLPAEILMGLPITVYMLLATVMTPITATFIQKIGFRRVFFIGAICSVLGNLACALSDSIAVIFMARALCGVSYALITMVCQSYIVKTTEHEERSERTKAMAIYTGITMTSVLCATAVGTLLADKFGFMVVFIFAVFISLMAMMFAAMMMVDVSVDDGADDDVADAHLTSAHGDSKSSTMGLLRNVRLMALLIGSAVSSKVVINGFLYFFIPVYLAHIGAGTDKTGHILIVYSLIIIFSSYFATVILSKFNIAFVVVMLATIGSGVMILGLNIASNASAVLVIATVLGIMHGFVKSPLAVAAIECVEHLGSDGRTAALSLLRIFERGGSIIGPLLMGFFLTHFTYVQSATILGVLVTICGIAMGFSNGFSWQKKVET